MLVELLLVVAVQVIPASGPGLDPDDAAYLDSYTSLMADDEFVRFVLVFLPHFERDVVVSGRAFDEDFPFVLLRGTPKHFELCEVRGNIEGHLFDL